MPVDISQLSDTEILALTIYGEARGEPIEGQIAVANVINNRFLNNPKKYKSISEVCLEPLQFSCWNMNDPNYTMLLELGSQIFYGPVPDNFTLKQCVWIATGIINDSLLDNTKRSKNYMTKTLYYSYDKPTWAIKAKVNVELGNHVFLTV